MFKKLINWKANRKKGFSLVELIVVIAIMAVLVAVLAPSLLSYTERSRSQKDDSAMSEVSNAILLGLSNANAYDEALEYSNPSNVSCYVDSDTETGRTPILTKAATAQLRAQYTFDDDARLADETQYFAGGNMRGLTITFEPVQGEGNQTKYVLEDGVINKFVGTKGRLRDTDFLYNLVRQTVGNDIILASQTYRNSEYTIFIKLGTTGGAQSSAQDAIEVYGQYSGTNLPVTDPASYGVTIDRNTHVFGDDEKLDDEDIEMEVNIHDGPAIPEGAIYGHTRSGNTTLYGQMPETVTIGDFYIYGDYIYTYETMYWDNGYSFNVKLLTEDNIRDLNLDGINCKDPQTITSAGEIISSINGVPIATMRETFENCVSLQSIAGIPNTVTEMLYTFANCRSLKVAPEIPTSVKRLDWAFDSCTSLETAPVISANVDLLYGAFKDCTSLRGNIIINTNRITSTEDYDLHSALHCFESVDMRNVTLTGAANSEVLNFIGRTGDHWSGGAISNGAGEHSGPAIPDGAFYGHKESGVTTLYDTMPSTASVGDFYVYGDYIYYYEQGSYEGWAVYLLTEDNAMALSCDLNITFNFVDYWTVTEVGPILSYINDKPVTKMDNTFMWCVALTSAPEIPGTVLSLYNTFDSCTSLETAPVIPASVKNMSYVFNDCASLTGIVTIHANPDVIENVFCGVNVDNIILQGTSSKLDLFINRQPETPTPEDPTFADAIYGSFSFINGTTVYETMPSTVSVGDFYVYGDYIYNYQQMSDGNYGWNVLLLTDDNTSHLGLELDLIDYWDITSAGEILSYINGKPVTMMKYTFLWCDALTSAPAIPETVVEMYATFDSCTSLETAPVIPASVKDMAYVFNECTGLTGTITINANPVKIKCVFNGVNVNSLTFAGTSSMLDAFRNNETIGY